jgi:hypothetical protein
VETDFCDVNIGALTLILDTFEFVISNGDGDGVFGTEFEPENDELLHSDDEDDEDDEVGGLLVILFLPLPFGP